MNRSKRNRYIRYILVIVTVYFLIIFNSPKIKSFPIVTYDSSKEVIGNSIEWKLVQVYIPIIDFLFHEVNDNSQYEKFVIQMLPLYEYMVAKESQFSIWDDRQIMDISQHMEEQILVENEKFQMRDSIEEKKGENPESEDVNNENNKKSGQNNEFSEEQNNEFAKEQNKINLEDNQDEKQETQKDNQEIEICSGEKKFTYCWEDYEDLENVKKDFYSVDSSTDINLEQIDPSVFLSKDFSIEKVGQEPQILIYHTHSQEAFIDSVEGDESTTVMGLGEHLAALLEEKGFSVIHHRGKYDIESRDYAYSNALPSIESILEKNPSIEVVIDLHRDAVSGDRRLVSNQDGKDVAKLMFFNGLSYTKKQGKISYLENPYIEENMAFSFQLQVLCNEYYPDSTRKIYLKGYRYNMHLRPKSLLVEVGAQTNTVEEAYRAMDILAHALDLCLTKKTEN